MTAGTSSIQRDRGRGRWRRMKGASKPSSTSVRGVKMRNDEGTARMTPRRRVGGYCSAETGDFEGEISRGEHNASRQPWERSRSYRESGNSRTPIKWTCSVREIKEKGEWRDEVVSPHKRYQRLEEDKSEITECKDERKKYLSHSLFLFLVTFLSADLTVRWFRCAFVREAHDNFESFWISARKVRIHSRSLYNPFMMFIKTWKSFVVLNGRY